MTIMEMKADALDAVDEVEEEDVRVVVDVVVVKVVTGENDAPTVARWAI